MKSPAKVLHIRRHLALLPDPRFLSFYALILYKAYSGQLDATLNVTFPHKIKCLLGPKHVDANKNTRMPPGCHADAMWMPHGHGKVYHTTELNTCDFCTLGPKHPTSGGQMSIAGAHLHLKSILDIEPVCKAPPEPSRAPPEPPKAPPEPPRAPPGLPAVSGVTKIPKYCKKQRI